jgi:quercetin dioxygenase-like cupin family protein
MTAETTFWMLGDLYTFKQTTPELAVVEVKTFPQNGPPLHIHHHEDESFYILEGTYEIQRAVRGDTTTIAETITANPGTLVHIPKNTLHTYKCVSTTPGRILILLSPGGLQNLWQELGEPATQYTVPPPRTAEGIQRLKAIAPLFSLEFPPPNKQHANHKSWR